MSPPASAGLDEHRSVRLIPREDWFTALLLAPTRRPDMSCDLTAPARLVAACRARAEPFGSHYVSRLDRF
jgi:hypothetical protein